MFSIFFYSTVHFIIFQLPFGEEISHFSLRLYSMVLVPVDTAEIALWIYRESKNHLLIEPAVASIFLLISKK